MISFIVLTKAIMQTAFVQSKNNALIYYMNLYLLLQIRFTIGESKTFQNFPKT